MNLQHYPLSMERYGKNPFGENLFRIVLADSRRYIVAGEWPDGSTYASEEQKYEQFKGYFILERWLSAFDFAGCSAETWDWRYSALGPYPVRGEYEFCHVFDTVSVPDSNIDKLVMWINEGKNRTPWEVYQGCRKNYDDTKQDDQRQAYDRIYDKLSAHLDYPMSGRYASRGSKTKEFKWNAAQTGLPVGNNKFIVKDTHA